MDYVFVVWRTGSCTIIKEYAVASLPLIEPLLEDMVANSMGDDVGWFRTEEEARRWAEMP